MKYGYTGRLTELHLQNTSFTNLPFPRIFKPIILEIPEPLQVYVHECKYTHCTTCIYIIIYNTLKQHYDCNYNQL